MYLTDALQTMQKEKINFLIFESRSIKSVNKCIFISKLSLAVLICGVSIFFVFVMLIYFLSS